VVERSPVHLHITGSSLFRDSICSLGPTIFFYNDVENRASNHISRYFLSQKLNTVIFNVAGVFIGQYALILSCILVAIL